MDLKLSDKTCLVTGASTGIGRATATGVTIPMDGGRCALASDANTIGLWPALHQHKPSSPA